MRDELSLSRGPAAFRIMNTTAPFDFSRHFDRVLVISLSRATDRQDAVSRQLAPGSFEWIWAVDKRTLESSDPSFNGRVDSEACKRHHPVGKSIQPGEVAVSLSHRLAYERMLENNWKTVLILEDDFVVDTKQIGLLARMQEELPVDWDVWYLGYDKRTQVPAGWPIKKYFYLLLHGLKIRTRYSRNTLHHFYPQPWSAHLNKAGFHDCLHAYAVNRKAAARLLHDQQPIKYVADHLVAHRVTSGDLQGFVSIPRLIYQPEQLSEDKIFSYRKND